MTAQLLGDSYLAQLDEEWLRRLVDESGCPVVNSAVDGARCTDLHLQVRDGCAMIVMSVGTNDATVWNRLPLRTFVNVLAGFLAARTERVLFLTPPGFYETSRVHGTHRLNEHLATYSDAGAEVVAAAGGDVLALRQVISGLGSLAYTEDGVHLTAAAYGRLVVAVAEWIRAHR